MFIQPDTAERFVTPEGHWVWAMNVSARAFGTPVRRLAHLVVLTPDALYHLYWPAADTQGWSKLVEPLKAAPRLSEALPKGAERIPYTSIRAVSYLAAKEMLEIEQIEEPRSAFARAMTPERPQQLFMSGTGMAEEIFRGLHQRIAPTLPVSSRPVRVDQIPVSPRELSLFLGALVTGVILFAASYGSANEPDPTGDLLRSLGAVPCRVLAAIAVAVAFGFGGWQLVRRPQKQVLELADSR